MKKRKDTGCRLSDLTENPHSSGDIHSRLLALIFLRETPANRKTPEISVEIINQENHIIIGWVN